MIAYISRLGPAKLILWCYLAWYVAVVCLYFDASPALWISSLAIGLVVGLALNLATRRPSQKADGWVIFRLFLIPFCVSSYSELINGKGFILLFPPDLPQLLVCVLSCLGVVVIHFVCRTIAAPPRRPGELPKS